MSPLYWTEVVGRFGKRKGWVPGDVPYLVAGPIKARRLRKVEAWRGVEVERIAEDLPYTPADVNALSDEEYKGVRKWLFDAACECGVEYIPSIDLYEPGPKPASPSWWKAAQDKNLWSPKEGLFHLR